MAEDAENATLIMKRVKIRLVAIHFDAKLRIAESYSFRLANPGLGG